MTDPDTRKRELAALGEAMLETGIESATVVTLREAGREETGSGPVSFVPAWQWFLGL